MVYVIRVLLRMLIFPVFFPAIDGVIDESTAHLGV
jgi:hypothetical protein